MYNVCMDEEIHNPKELGKLENLLKKIALGTKEGKGINHFNDSILDAYNDKIISKNEMIMIMAFANQRKTNETISRPSSKHS